MLRVFVATLFVIVTLLWFSSYTHHSSIGLDHDIAVENHVEDHYYRINWTGHGSILIGYGISKKLRDRNVPLEKFDPAGVLLTPHKKPLPPSHSIWNDLGFWLIQAPAARTAFWVGIPSWLPVLLLALLLLYLRKSRSVNP